MHDKNLIKRLFKCYNILKTDGIKDNLIFDYDALDDSNDHLFDKKEADNKFNKKDIYNL